MAVKTLRPILSMLAAAALVACGGTQDQEAKKPTLNDVLTACMKEKGYGFSKFLMETPLDTLLPIVHMKGNDNFDNSANLYFLTHDIERRSITKWMEVEGGYAARAVSLGTVPYEQAPPAEQKIYDAVEDCAQRTIKRPSAPAPAVVPGGAGS